MLNDVQFLNDVKPLADVRKLNNVLPLNNVGNPYEGLFKGEAFNLGIAATPPTPTML